MYVSAPRSPRDLISHFRQYDPATGLQSILHWIDTSGMTRHQVYGAVFGRFPAALTEVAVPGTYNPTIDLRKALISAEFQEQITELLLRAFPEQRRAIFVHIPKCAGTDLNDSLVARYPTIHNHLAMTHLVARPLFFERLAEISLRLTLSDTIFVSGHVRLDHYLQTGLARPSDDLFTVVRDPRAIPISTANFVATRMTRDRELDPRAAAEWRQHFGLEHIPEEPTEAFLLELASRVLHDPSITPPNVICTFLGRGDADSTLELIALSNIEITDTERYNAWKRERWKIQRETRRNQSLAILHIDNLSRSDQDYVTEITTEDQKIYDRIIRRLQATDGAAIRGISLIENA